MTTETATDDLVGIESGIVEMGQREDLMTAHADGLPTEKIIVQGTLRRRLGFLRRKQRQRGNGNLRLCSKMLRSSIWIGRSGSLRLQSKRRLIVKLRIERERGLRNIAIKRIL
jgi:hypothetical protein